MAFPFASKEQGGKECSPYWQVAEWYLFFGLDREPPQSCCPALFIPAEVQALSFTCLPNVIFLSFQCISTPSLFPHHLTLLRQNPPKNNLCPYSRFLSPLGGCSEALTHALQMTRGFLGCLLKNLLGQKSFLFTDSKDVQSRTDFAKIRLGGKSSAWKIMWKDGIKKEEHLISKILRHMIHESGNCGSRPECLLFLTPSGLLQIFFINAD